MTSYHHLVVVKMKPKLKKHWITGKTALQNLNTEFLLANDKLNKFKISLNNRF